jgi:hypothetical protein
VKKTGARKRSSKTAHKKASSRVVRKKKHTIRTIKKSHAKKATPRRKARPYNQQAGQLSGREIKAEARLKKLTEQYIAEGIDPGSARQHARDVMRDNPRKDWRGG